MMQKRAYSNLESVRRRNNIRELDLLVDSIDEMTSHELHSLLTPYIEFVDYSGNSVGPSKDREEVEKWKYVVPDVLVILEIMLLIARHWVMR